MLARLVAGLCCSTIAAVAQEHDVSAPRAALGAIVAGGGGISSTSVPVFEGSSECGVFRSGIELEALAGGSASFAQALGPLGLDVALWLAGTRTTYTTPPAVPTRITDEASASIVELEREYRREHRQVRAGVDVLARLDLGGSFWIAAGPSIALNIADATEQSDNVNGPENRRFADGQSRHLMSGSHLSEPTRLLAGAVIELGRTLPIGTMTIAPFIAARGDISSRYAGAEARSLELLGGCRLLFDMTSAPDATPVAVSDVEVATPARIPPLTAQLAIYGVDASGRRQSAPLITVREIHQLDHLPLVPAVFFDEGADTISARYVSRADARTSDASASDAVDPILAIQRSVLDTIGARLQVRRDVTLQLWGSAAAGERPSLASTRVASVREYLENNWGIEPSRLVAMPGAGPLERSSEAGADGRADNRRVEIAASDPTLIEPVMARHVVRLFDPPAIELEPIIDAPAGLADWTIALKHREVEVARFERGDDDEKLPFWSILPSSIDEGLGDLVAELDVVDSSNARVSATATTQIRFERELTEVDRRVVRQGDRDVARYHLVAFEFDRVEPGPINERELAAIARALEPGTRVSIAGTADRIGEEQHNAELSRRRAEAVAEQLRAMLRGRAVDDISIVVDRAAPHDEPFSNDLPEGRFLSRGVVVTTERRR